MRTVTWWLLRQQKRWPGPLSVVADLWQRFFFCSGWFCLQSLHFVAHFPVQLVTLPLYSTPILHDSKQKNSDQSVPVDKSEQPMLSLSTRISPIPILDNRQLHSSKQFGTSSFYNEK